MILSSSSSSILLGADLDGQTAQYQHPSLPPSSPAVQPDNVGRRTAHDAIYDDGYVDRDGVYHHYDDRRYDDERYYGGGGGGGVPKYMASSSIPSDVGGESVYDADELMNDEAMSSVPARSSIDSSAAAAALRSFDRYYDDRKTDSFESYDRDSTAAYDASVMKDSGYQTFNLLQQQQQQPLPSEPPPSLYFNHVDDGAWPQQPPPPTVSAGDVQLRRSPITIIDAQTPRQSFLISHPADNTFAPSAAADRRWSGSCSPPASYPDGLSNAPAVISFADRMMLPISPVDPASIG